MDLYGRVCVVSHAGGCISRVTAGHESRPSAVRYHIVIAAFDAEKPFAYYVVVNSAFPMFFFKYIISSSFFGPSLVIILIKEWGEEKGNNYHFS